MKKDLYSSSYNSSYYVVLIIYLRWKCIQKLLTTKNNFDFRCIVNIVGTWCQTEEPRYLRGSYKVVFIWEPACNHNFNWFPVNMMNIEIKILIERVFLIILTIRQRKGVMICILHLMAKITRKTTLNIQILWFYAT